MRRNLLQAVSNMSYIYNGGVEKEQSKTTSFNSSETEMSRIVNSNHPSQVLWESGTYREGGPEGEEEHDRLGGEELKWDGEREVDHMGDR